MTERPIIFSGAMVRALLSGAKTQTRRIVLKGWDPESIEPPWLVPEWAMWVTDNGNGGLVRVTPIKVGDRLWVRENWRPDILDADDPARTIFMADVPGKVLHDLRQSGIRWRPSIHLPRNRSRLTLVVTEVRVERLQAISADDVEAEGLYRGKARRHLFWPNVTMCQFLEGRTHKAAFEDLWDSINGAGAWEANPWVVAVSFVVERGVRLPDAPKDPRLYVRNKPDAVTMPRPGAAGEGR